MLAFYVVLTYYSFSLVSIYHSVLTLCCSKVDLAIDSDDALFTAVNGVEVDQIPLRGVVAHTQLDGEIS